MKKYILICLLCLPLLQGCDTFLRKTENQNSVPAANTRIVVDPKLLQVCEPLKPLPITDVTYEIIADHYLGIISSYGVCSQKQDASISAIKKLANIKE